KAKRAYNGRKDCGGLEHRKSTSDADTRASAERQEGKAWSCLDQIRRKAIRIKGIGAVPKTGVPMESKDGNMYSCSWGKLHVADFDRCLRDPRDPGGRRKESPRLLHTLAAKRQALVTRRIDRPVSRHASDFVKHPLLRGLVLGQQPKRPNEGDGGRLVARGDEGEKIGHDLVVAHASPGFGIAGGAHQIEQIRFEGLAEMPRGHDPANIPMQEITR